MFLLAHNSNVVVSAALQILESGLVVAHVYFDDKKRSYEDCVRYGRCVPYDSLSSLISIYVSAYEKVTLSAHD